LKVCFTRGLFVTIFILTFVVAWNAHSAPTQALKDISQLEKDLSLMEGRIIYQETGVYMLNKGLDQGVKKGDLWIVYAKGHAIKDPATGRLLGSSSPPLAFAIVVDAEKNYSTLQLVCIRPGCKIVNGLYAKRYKGIPAYFYDKDGRYRPLYEWARMKLSHLDWTWYQQIVDESEIQQEDHAVIFVAHGGRLTLWSGKEVTGLYKIPQSLVEKSELFQPTQYATPAIKKRTDYRVDTYDHMVVSMGIVKNSEGPFLVYLANQTLYARSLDSLRNYTFVYKGFGQPLNISVGPNGLLAFNIFDKKEGMKSRIVKLEKGGFRTISKDIDYILGFFDTDLDLEPDTLYAQNWDDESFWGAGVYKFDIRGGKLTNQKKVKMPDDFKIFGSFYSDLNGNGKKEIGYYNRKGRLCLVEEGKQIWESSIRMDGSIQVVQFDNPDDPELPVPDNKPVWPTPALIQGTERQAVAVPVNSSDMWGAVGGAPDEGDVRMLYFTKVRFLFPSLPYNFGGPVQSVFTYDGKLYCVVVEGDVFRKKGKTHVFAYPLEEVLAHVI